MAQPITSDEYNRVVCFVVDAAKTAVAQATFLDKEGAQLVIIHGDELKVAIERATINALKQLSFRYPVLAETRLLKPASKSTAPARTKPVSVAEFYRTRSGLYVYDTFAERLDLMSARAETVDSALERPYVASLLKANAYDKDIRKELPENHLSTLEDIAGLIEAQPNGKSGFLLNDGHVNIFYVEGKNGEVFAVDVYWRYKWNVYNWRLDGLDGIGYWRAGYQVLCPGNATL